MTKNEFPFVVGYVGDIAIIDKKFKNKFKGKTVAQLVEAGQYKAAYCLALFTGDKDKELIANSYNNLSGSRYNVADLERLFGVFTIAEAAKIKVL
ncbi:MAG: hypothetical protein FWE37_08570 [Spirochaetaceae bacterium]|nr:hypothetical protein [Spirochaetaceae bacterium]